MLLANPLCCPLVISYLEHKFNILILFLLSKMRCIIAKTTITTKLAFKKGQKSYVYMNQMYEEKTS